MSTVGTPKSPEEIQKDWDTNPRWMGITREYSAAVVVARPVRSIVLFDAPAHTDAESFHAPQASANPNTMSAM